MKWQDPYDPEPVSELQRDMCQRTFQQMHQSPEYEDMTCAELYRRSNLYILCEHCGLPHREHPYYDEYLGLRAEPIDHRLCGGEIVHL